MYKVSNAMPCNAHVVLLVKLCTIMMAICLHVLDTKEEYQYTYSIVIDQPNLNMYITINMINKERK